MRLSAEQLDLAASTPPLGLYIHVPFCLRRCLYCDFNSNVFRPELASPFVKAVLAELSFWRHRLDLSNLRTVFLGGGTPTVLPADELERLIEGIMGIGHWALGIGKDPSSPRPNSQRQTPNAQCPITNAPSHEFTVEANPATVDLPLGRQLRGLGVNRLSLGAQSFDPADLALLGRIHSAEQIGRSVGLAREAGFANINLDLMYGLPGQSLAGWRANLAAAVGLGVEHLSCYALSLEPHTPLTQSVEAGRVTPLPDETAVAMYRATIADLAAAGFEHYEISNWARTRAPSSPEVANLGALPSWHCRHNLLYWENRPWLGLGPSAASYLGGLRFRGVGDLASYISAATGGQSGQQGQQQGQPEYEDIERLTGLAAVGEAIMLALRMRRGLDPAEFAARYGVDVGRQFAAPIARHLEAGLLRWREGRLQLTETALPVADSVLVDFIAES